MNPVMLADTCKYNKFMKAPSQAEVEHHSEEQIWSFVGSSRGSLGFRGKQPTKETKTLMYWCNFLMKREGEKHQLLQTFFI